MSERSTVQLWHRQSRNLVDAKLIDELTELEIVAAAGSWKPHIDARVTQLTAAGVPRPDWPQHAHWDWEKKAHWVSGVLAYQVVGIECGGDMQGMMIVATEGKACRILAQQGKPLVYVSFLATAPWNDRDFVPDPRYGGIGKLMIAAATQLSIDNGFKGRIGLHSLPQSEAFYADCTMTDLDRDPAVQGLRYYEFTQEQAQAFLTRGDV